MILGQEKTKEKLKIAAENNIPTLIIGETGVGKTSIIREVAPKEQQVMRVNLNGQTSTEDFVGRKGLKDQETFWEDGILLNCMRNGHWIIIDEINAALPEILFVLHSLLDDGQEVLVPQNDNEVVKPHEDFRVFATMNPVGEYAGTKTLNKALKSRFGMILRMTYPSNEIERKIIKRRTNVEEEDKLTQMMEVANTVRDLKDDDEIFFTLSTRDLIQWGHLTESLGLVEAFRVTILNKAGEDSDTIQENLMGMMDEIEKIKEEHDVERMGIDWFKEQFEKIEEKEKNIRERVRKEEKEKLRQEVINQITSKFKNI